MSETTPQEQLVEYLVDAHSNIGAFFGAQPEHWPNGASIATFEPLRASVAA